MTLVILHYHLRPGGIRRVIELATPQLVRRASQPVTRVLLATSQRPSATWQREFARRLGGARFELFIARAFSYLSEQRGGTNEITARVRRALDMLFARAADDRLLVWAHNLGVGRNLILSREIAGACAQRRITLVSHHHDWWFDNRWSRWPEMRRRGFRTLAHAAATVFPSSDPVLHAAINQPDAAILTRHLGRRALWLPNLVESASAPSATRMRAVQRWLHRKFVPPEAPIWLLPCRTLRRKNMAEALLLTRWLRPEAWLVVTGGASSQDERPYFHALDRAARRHQWPLRLGVLAGSAPPATVADLFAASETALLTSVQEGFGLPYLEAAAADRPLLARRLPNIFPDLERFGFRFPQAYDEVWIAPELFDWPAEIKRQRRLFQNWLATMPAAARAWVARPQLLASVRRRPVAFSRLTLTAQLEVLSHAAHESWQACAALNPLLAAWRQRAAARKLRVTPWPRLADAWLSGEAYAQRFYDALTRRHAGTGAALPFRPVRIQADFIREKLDLKNLHPILWNRRT